MIDAESRAAARAAQANLAGGLRAAADAARAQLAAVLEEIAGAIDYPDEVPEPARERVRERVDAVDARLDALVRDWERWRLVREGLSLAIVGPPNAGKSSLLNALLGEERAIVSELAGTTRDVIEETFAVDGVPVRVLDTAGLRASEDRIERIGIDRARRALESAAVALVVVDGSVPLDADARVVLEQTRGRERVVLFNKRDLGTRGYDARDAAENDAISGQLCDARAAGVSTETAATHETVEAVRRAIARAGWGGESVDLARPHLASARQADAVARARDALAHARTTLNAAEPLDLVAPELLAATAALAEVTGAAATEAVLDGVFARFCIGK